MAYAIDAAKDRPRLYAPDFKKTAEERIRLQTEKANNKKALREKFGDKRKKHINP